MRHLHGVQRTIYIYCVSCQMSCNFGHIISVLKFLACGRLQPIVGQLNVGIVPYLWIQFSRNSDHVFTL